MKGQVTFYPQPWFSLGHILPFVQAEIIPTLSAPSIQLIHSWCIKLSSQAVNDLQTLPGDGGQVLSHFSTLERRSLRGKNWTAAYSLFFIWLAPGTTSVHISICFGFSLCQSPGWVQTDRHRHLCLPETLGAQICTLGDDQTWHLCFCAELLLEHWLWS